MEKTIRFLLVRLGMDAHWRGSMVVARALRDAGIEVIYGGNQMPETIVRMALQENADIIGLSSFSGNHMILAPQVIKLLKKEKAGDIRVVLGGTVPSADIPKLKRAGVVEIFGPGSSIRKIVECVKALGNSPLEKPIKPKPKIKKDRPNITESVKPESEK